MNASLAQHLTIGQLAARSGLATSALRFYEEQGLIASERTAGNQRRFKRSVLRQVAVIRAAQAVGLSLQEIRAALESMPSGSNPNKADWQRLSRSWKSQLEERIAALERLKGNLTGCISCGCLSLDTCALINKGDIAATRGVDGSYLISPKA